MTTETKGSGVKWIGTVPADWEINKIKYIASLKGRIGWQGLTSEEYTDEGAYLITGVDFENGGINWDSCVHVPMHRWEEARDIQIEDGDLLITKDGTIGKVAIVSGCTAPTSLNSGVLRISTIEGYDRQFLYWVLLSDVFWTWFVDCNIGNSTIQHLYQGDFAEFKYAIPPIEEQRAIATFLEIECSKVDCIIADIEHQIEILRNHRNSLVTEAVTKGLNPSIPMRDSGIDWLGKIPVDWKVSRIKYLIDSSHPYPIGDGDHGLIKADDYLTEGIPYIRVLNLTWGQGLNLENMVYISEAMNEKIKNSTLMLYRFRFEIQIGDYVVFPSKSNREINIGIVDGEYQYEASAQEYVNRRKVKWLKHFPRTAFSQGALYESGSAMSLFTIKNYADEFLASLDTGFKKTALEDEDESVGATAEEIKQSTKDFILKELSRNLKGYALESFVADLLNAMGYRTELSPQGGDSGIDITAYKDELPPRILVQVKSQDGDIRETTIQSLKGAMREGDYGLFISLSGYTKNARKYLDSTPIIRGIDGDELVTLVLKYYENLSPKYKKVIPLERVYIPVPADE